MTVRVVVYNILMDDLSSNFVPRTMDELPLDLVTELFGAPRAEEKWSALKLALSEEYKKWHPLKHIVLDPCGDRVKLRGLWSDMDLSTVASRGWNLQGADVTTNFSLRAPGGTDDVQTFMGVLRKHLDEEMCQALYEHISNIEQDSRVWKVRGEKLLNKILSEKPTFLILTEYDVHDLPTGEHATFREAMRSNGYEGVNFLGPGQEKCGMGIFWLLEKASLAEEAELPASRVLPCGVETQYFGNLDLQEEGMRDSDRRPLPFVRLLAKGQHFFVCGVHLMTTSRDKTGSVRASELAQIRKFLSTRVCNEAVVLGGDFNIDSRDRRDEHVWKGNKLLVETGYEEHHCEGKLVRTLKWERLGGRVLCLLDAHGDINTSLECATTRTGSRTETIDHVFYDDSLELVGRSDLKCPDEQMPNKTEPSDHILLCVDLCPKQLS